METCLKRLRVGVALTAALIAAGSGEARAQFSENFDSGSATFTVNDPFWLNNALANGYVIKTTNSGAVFGGAFGNEIPVDVSGTGYFLFEGTDTYPGNGGLIPVGQDEFYISPTFGVKANTLYNVSFYATSANGINSPSLQPEIDGSLLGSPVVPVGDYGTSGWQQFTYTWNSGSNTTASLILHDYVQTTYGNDFGVDNIVVASAATPEPNAVALCAAVSVTGLGLLVRRRRRSLQA